MCFCVLVLASCEKKETAVSENVVTEEENDHINLPTQNFELSNEAKAQKLQELIDGVARDDIVSISELGHAYQTGELGVQDDNKAFELLKLASDKGDSNSMLLLAPLYIIGVGVEKNYEEAFALFQKATDLGNMKAPRYLATHFELGIGTPIDFVKAAEYYQLAADRNDITALCQLGTLYERGLGVPQDYEKAEELYLASSVRSDVIASGGWACLGNLYETRTDGKKDYDIAREYYQKAHDIGNPDGTAGLLRLGHRNLHPWEPGHNLSITVLLSVSDLFCDPIYEQAIHEALVTNLKKQDSLAQ